MAAPQANGTNVVRNKKLVFAEIPTAVPVPGQHLVVKEDSIDLGAALGDGGLLVQNLYLSFDPYQRARMRDPSIKSYFPPFSIGATIDNSGIARVVRSANPAFKAGDVVKINAVGKAEEYSYVASETVEKHVKVISNEYGVDLVHYLGTLGMAGATAFSSLYEIGDPKPGETIYISAASGAVGAVVGQVAKHIGLKVIGSVGSDDKADYLKECGFDHAINYKKDSIDAKLAEYAPDGIDIYYENVGGETLEIALKHMRDLGRVIACGMISQYNLPADQKYGIRNLAAIVQKQIKMQGFLVSNPNFGPKYAQRQLEFLGPRLKDGSLKARTDVTKGLDHAAEGFVGMLRGDNFGKAVLEIAPLQ